MKTFIIGVAGNVGSRLAAKLKARGAAVDGLYRRTAQGARLQALGVDATHGDLVAMDAQALADAVRGADALVFSAGAAGEGGPAMTTAIDGEGLTKSIEAARLAGVSRLLLVSAFPEAGRQKPLSETFEHYMAVKKQADMELAESGLDWVILRPGTLTDDPGSGRIRIGPALTYGSVPRDDVAETLAALVLATGVSRRILELTEGEVPVAEAIDAL